MIKNTEKDIKRREFYEEIIFRFFINTMVEIAPNNVLEVGWLTVNKYNKACKLLGVNPDFSRAYNDLFQILSKIESGNYMESFLDPESTIDLTVKMYISEAIKELRGLC